MSRARHWLDERLDLTGIRHSLLDRPVARGLTWWHTLGSATLAVFMVQVVTGVVLAMYYSPSPDHAHESIRYIERVVTSGTVVRGIHHWGSSAMVVLTVAHMLRVFTMGAYKYPREVNWLLGVALLFVVLGFGFTGYLLPYDQKAYWATQVGTNIAGTTPLIGAKLVTLLRGGSQQGAATLTRFYSLHVLLLPLLLVGVVALHLVLVVRQGVAPRAKELEAGAPPRTTDTTLSGLLQPRPPRSEVARASLLAGHHREGRHRRDDRRRRARRARHLRRRAARGARRSHRFRVRAAPGVVFPPVLPAPQARPRVAGERDRGRRPDS